MVRQQERATLAEKQRQQEIMCFSGLKRGLRLAELVARHEQLAQMKMCG